MLLILSLSGQTPNGGIIHGIVRDEPGGPVSGAKVHAQMRGRAMATAIRYVTTDAAGSFIIDRLEYGTYDVFVEKDEDDYAPSEFSLYSDGPPGTVTLSSRYPEGTVALQLGARASVVTGTARDARTGKPIPPAFTIRCLDDPHRMLGTSVAPEFRILVPSSTDVSLEVSSPGYQHWTYLNPNTRSQKLHLKPGEEMHLEILLEPSKIMLKDFAF